MTSIHIAGYQLAEAIKQVRLLCGSEVRLYAAGGEKRLIATANAQQGGSLIEGRADWAFSALYNDPVEQAELYEPKLSYVMEFDRDKDGELVASRLNKP